MAALTQTCAKCTKQFLIIDTEQQFLKEKGIPLPVNCPQCRQERRLALRGGRQLFRTKCQKCGKDIVTSYDPATATSQILCREDYDKWAHEVDPVINEPLPDAPGVTPQPAPQPMQPAQPQMPQQVNYVAQAPTASPDANRGEQNQ